MNPTNRISWYGPSPICGTICLQSTAENMLSDDVVVQKHAVTYDCGSYKRIIPRLFDLMRGIWMLYASPFSGLLRKSKKAKFIRPDNGLMSLI